MDLFDKLKQVRISKRARRGAVLGLCLCAAAGLGMHLLPGGAPAGCTQEDLADTRAVMAVQASVSGSTDAQSGAAADKVVYLTFDDGPSATTESGLDTLKAEGVPATFFVMAADNNEEYLPLLERTVQEGHLIALHTCSHDYKSIYKSPDAYWDDLQKLREKLQQSFSRVSEQLESVYKGLGEMQTLATGVGDLKKVLSNVKTRGILGEIQLGAILEQILAPEQYAENVATVKGSSERVEYAVRLPGDGTSCVYLPIDAKFPIDAYNGLLDAYDTADAAQVEAAAKVLEQRIRQFAKDIHTKYIHVPETTDFGIMFLPIEGLYAEVVRRGMVERLQAEFKVVIAGPTTMAALLNSLQMGFKTLAIQKRSSEVWDVLSSVKSEFETFGTALEQAQTRINQAGNALESLVGVRTRQIQRKLRSVTTLPEAGAAGEALEE